MKTLTRWLPIVPIVVGAFLSCSPLISPRTAAAQASAAELQRRAVSRIDAYRDHVRRTLDQTSRVGDLLQAVAELRSGTFIRNG